MICGKEKPKEVYSPFIDSIFIASLTFLSFTIITYILTTNDYKYALLIGYITFWSVLIYEKLEQISNQISQN